MRDPLHPGKWNEFLIHFSCLVGGENMGEMKKEGEEMDGKKSGSNIYNSKLGNGYCEKPLKREREMRHL